MEYMRACGAVQDQAVCGSGRLPWYGAKPGQGRRWGRGQGNEMSMGLALLLSKDHTGDVKGLKRLLSLGLKNQTKPVL